MNEETSDAAAASLNTNSIYRSFKRSPQPSIKHRSYFQVYEDLFEKHRNTAFTFVEIGILDGGSLFMWRDYFGPKARIIGIDLNPNAMHWGSEGFEIYIGSQSDPYFWKEFFEKVGTVDVVLDDGGHTFEQQIVTVHSCLPHVSDGGIIVVEDTHTSYFREFGYPSRWSFIEWAKKIADTINGRFPSVTTSQSNYRNSIYSVTFFESIVCFKIDRRRCFENSPIQNISASIKSADFRHQGSASQTLVKLHALAAKAPKFLKGIRALRLIADAILSIGLAVASKARNRKLRKYFEEL